jgi:hypothetical protein
MNWVQNIRQRHSLSKFRKRTQKVNFPHSFVDIERAQTIGFIVNAEQISADDLVMFTKYITQLEDKGKKVVVVEINHKRKSEPMFQRSMNTVFINPSQINWMMFPSVGKLEELNKFRCDILVNLDMAEQMTSRYVCGLSNAQTRVGLHEEGQEEFYELMLQLPADTKLSKLLETFETYSKMLEK